MDRIPDFSENLRIPPVRVEVAIGRAGPGRVGSTVDRAKIGPGQNWPDFFGPKF